MFCTPAANWYHRPFLFSLIYERAASIDRRCVRDRTHTEASSGCRREMPTHTHIKTHCQSHLFPHCSHASFALGVIQNREVRSCECSDVSETVVCCVCACEVVAAPMCVVAPSFLRPPSTSRLHHSLSALPLGCPIVYVPSYEYHSAKKRANCKNERR